MLTVIDCLFNLLSCDYPQSLCNCHNFGARLCLLHLPESPCIIKVMILYCLVDCHLVAVAAFFGVGSRSSHYHAIIAFLCIVAFVKNSSSSLIVASKKVISCNQCRTYLPSNVKTLNVRFFSYCQQIAWIDGCQPWSQHRIFSHQRLIVLYH